MLFRDRVRLRTTRQQAVHQQPCRRIARRVQEIEHRLLPLHQSDLVRIRIKAQRPLVDCAAASLIANRRELRRFADPVRQAAPILSHQPFRQRHIAYRRCQENVRFRAALQQESRHVRRLADSHCAGVES